MAQPAQVETQYFVGQGMVFIAERDTTTGKPKKMRHIGNVPKLETSLKTTVLELKESMTGTRGLSKRITTECAASFSATLESLNSENLAIALRGTTATEIAGTVVKQTYTAYANSLLPLDHIGISAVTVYDAATGLVPYVSGTDYVVNNNNISIPATGAIAALDIGGAGTDVKISYSYSQQEKVEAFAGTDKEYYVYFDGLNTADENAPVVVEIYKVAIDPLKTLAFIGDKQGEIVFEGSCLLDSTRTSGSQYFTITRT